MASRLADRLRAARHDRFVGREAERELFSAAISAAQLPFHVLYIFGPGGVGKTSLLLEIAYSYEQTDTRVAYLDARNLEPAPEPFESALHQVLGLDSGASLFDALAGSPSRHVLMIDTYERLAPLDPWLRQTFLPQLPESVLIVLAGRNPPSPAWRTDPGWQTLIHTVSLRNLSTDESRTFLAKRAIPEQQHSSVLNFTRGHPLALSLVADIFAQRDDSLHDFQLDAAPDVIKILLERLVQKVPGPSYRAALEACAMVRVTTEALLAEMLATPDAHEMFDWLRELSFIESRRGGLFPHDLVREALAADLRWRNPDWYTELHRRARAYYTTRLEQASGQTQQRLLLDLIFLHRDSAMVRPFFEWQVSGATLTDSLRADDVDALLAMVAAHEGQKSAELAAHWFARQPEGVRVFRDSDGQPAGLLAMVALDQARAEDLEIDPAARAGWGYLQRQARLRPGEVATLFRFWMAHDTYQAVSPIQSLIFLNIVRHYLTTPGLAFTIFPCAEPEFWAPMCAYAELVRLPEAEFEVEGRRYGCYGHDWRALPPAAWLSLLAEREVSAEPKAVPPPQAAEPLLVLSQPDFEQAARDALHDVARPEALRANPLLRSRLIVERAGASAGQPERINALLAVLKEAADQLQASPREVKFYRALYHTYFHPAPTQEQAAELLDVPFSTFRRHLKAGVARLTETLWQREIGGSPK